MSGWEPNVSRLGEQRVARKRRNLYMFLLVVLNVTGVFDGMSWVRYCHFSVLEESGAVQPGLE